MLIPKVFLSRDISNNELFQIVEDGLGIGEIKEVKKDLNNVEVLTEWSRFELRLNDREVSIYQRWAKDKMIWIVGIIIVSFFLWLPLIFIFYKMYEERKISKEILEKIGARINS